MTRWTIGLRVAFAAGILLCPSPACWPQQVARQSGLLLGLADPSDEKLKYQTLWLHPSASHVNTRLLQGLVVPRQDGFWRVDSADTCSLDIEGDDGIERSVDGENNDDRRISVSVLTKGMCAFLPAALSNSSTEGTCQSRMGRAPIAASILTALPIGWFNPSVEARASRSRRCSDQARPFDSRRLLRIIFKMPMMRTVNLRPSIRQTGASLTLKGAGGSRVTPPRTGCADTTKILI